MGSCQCSATTSIIDDQKTQRIYIIFSKPSLTHSNVLRYLIATIGDGVIVSYQDGATLIYYAYIIYHIYYTYLQHIQTEPKWIHRILPTPTAELPGRCVHQVPRLGDSTESRGFGLDGLDEDGGIVEKRYFQRNKKCKVESIVGFMFFCGHEISIAFIFCHHILSYLYIMILY